MTADLFTRYAIFWALLAGLLASAAVVYMYWKERQLTPEQKAVPPDRRKFVFNYLLYSLAPVPLLWLIYKSLEWMGFAPESAREYIPWVIVITLLNYYLFTPFIRRAKVNLKDRFGAHICLVMALFIPPAAVTVAYDNLNAHIVEIQHIAALPSTAAKYVRIREVHPRTDYLVWRTSWEQTRSSGTKFLYRSLVPLAYDAEDTVFDVWVEVFAPPAWHWNLTPAQIDSVTNVSKETGYEYAANFPYDSLVCYLRQAPTDIDNQVLQYSHHRKPAVTILRPYRSSPTDAAFDDVKGFLAAYAFLSLALMALVFWSDK